MSFPIYGTTGYIEDYANISSFILVFNLLLFFYGEQSIEYPQHESCISLT
jgi:hypothetical protein